MFKTVYDMIIEDNRKNGLIAPAGNAYRSSSREPDNRLRPVVNTSPRPLSMPPATVSGSEDVNELFLPPPPPYAPPHSTSHDSRPKPAVHAKPKGLQSRPRTTNGAVNGMPVDLLAERFSQLRVPRKVVPIVGDEVPQDDQDVESITSPTELTPPSSDGSPPSRLSTHADPHISATSSKPSGPRSMLPASNNPPPPPKIPLDIPSNGMFPRAPSPAYDPSKTVVSPSGTGPSIKGDFTNVTEAQQPFQTSQRSLTNSYVQNYSSRKSNDTSPSANSSRPNSAEYPQPTSIAAADLSEKLKVSDILMIDVRSREEFDQGHVFAKSIICVEPLSLRSGLSAEELEETLVVSPTIEQDCFERRNEFDLVVYYDQSTESDFFLSGPPANSGAFAMRALHDTIYEFSYSKSLRRRPVMLRGGLDAWTDLVGHGGLVTSQTAALIGSTRSRRSVARPGRPIGRVPMANSNLMEVRRRRLREYREQKPLNADEEKSWRETARNEEVEPAEFHSDGDADSNYSYSEEPPFVRSYEEFLKKFPEPSAMQQSMTVPLPPPPSRPPPSMPSIPSRPAPAAPRPSYSGVSERASSQISPTSRLPLSAQPPLYTSRTITHYLKLPRTGLVNRSVTCYMNATIQCLLATIPLSEFFLNNRWRDSVQKNWKGSNGIMPEIYANLIRSLWKGDVDAIHPSTLRNLCARLNPEWGFDKQQDAKEYLDFLLDCLHEDLNENWQKPALPGLTAEQELNREAMPVHQVSKIEWSRYSRREESHISKLFAGQHASRLRCTTCKNTSTTYEAFYSISVEIPRKGRGADIHDCLRSYCQEEKLSKEEMWNCPHCKCQREATKQIFITRAPQFLVVHFKRFSASKTESARKIHTPINFPLHGLNLESYMVAQQSGKRKEVAAPAADGSKEPDLAITPPFLYDAYAVMRHIGSSMGGGHYISLVRDVVRGCWRKFDDAKVSDFDPNKLKSDQKLQNDQAYLVFYGRQVAR